MTDRVRPDPVTRDHIAHHAYVSTYCLHAAHGDCRLTCKVCSAVCLCTCHTAPPPLPDEPPDGAVLRIAWGKETRAAERDDDIESFPGDEMHWVVAGHREAYSWATLCDEFVVDPGRRLVERGNHDG